MWALGRTANPDILKSEDPSFTVVAPSDIPLEGKPVPRPLTTAEIQDYVRIHGEVAENAVNKAGFDGVEMHMAAGYLPDQFLQDTSNKRTDNYGGSIENRCRFPLEVIDAVVQAIGQERTAIRISPWGRFQGKYRERHICLSMLNFSLDMRMAEPMIIPTFSYFVSRIRELYPKFAYLHAIEPRVFGFNDIDPGTDSNDFLRELWKPLAFISAGGHTRETAMEAADKTGELAAFGRSFISNVRRLMPLRDSQA